MKASPAIIKGNFLFKTIYYQDQWFDQEIQGNGLKDKSIKGGISTTVSQLVVFIANTLSTIVLARILLPSDFGLIAMVAAFSGFVTIFKDLGVSMSIIRKARVTHDQVSILFWFNTGFCLFISLVFVGAAPLIVSFYEEPKLFSIIIVYAVSIFISSLSVIHNAILSRKMEFKKISIVNVISSMVAVGISVVMGLTGFGYWSLVFLTLFQSLAFTIILWIYCPWKPKFIFWQKGIKEFLHFGAGISGFNIINYFSRNMDNVIIGKFLGTAMLGFYSKAYQLMMLPLTKLRDPLISVGTPALSSLIQEPDRYKRYYQRLLFIICFFSFPMTAFLGIFAKELIVTVLGPKWMESVFIFQWLSVSALIQPITGTTGAIFISAGKSTQFLKMGIVSAVVIISSFLIGIHWGIHGVVIAYAIATYLLLIPTLLYCFKGTPLKLRPLLRELSLPALHTLILCTLLLALKIFLSAWLSSILTLLIALTVSIPVYYYSWRLYEKGRDKISDIKDLINSAKNKAGTMFRFFNPS